MYLRILALAISVVAWPALADDPDIRQLMTKAEFKEAGLENLSDSQIAALNRWLIRYTAQDAAILMSTSEAVKESAQDTIKSQIDGQFNGWRGKTRFVLKNGQVWETRYDRRYSYSAVDPEVEITKNFMGFHTLTVVKTGRFVGVKRIK